MEIDEFLRRVQEWAEQQADIEAVLLVGSYARGAARPDSDVDLVILTTRPERYVDSVSFAGQFGSISKWQTEDWGRVTSQRVWYQDGLEVEFGITLPDWSARPLDPGTRAVLSDGAQVVFDRSGALDWVERGTSGK